LVAVTVVQMFVAARQKSAYSGQLERALVVAQDWVERLSGADDADRLLSDAGFALADQDTYVLERAEAGLVIEARVEPEAAAPAGKIRSATVRVFGGEWEEALVALPAVRYVPMEEVRP